MFGFADKRIVYATKIGFIGLGKLGMPCAEAIAKKGFDVVGYTSYTRQATMLEYESP